MHIRQITHDELCNKCVAECALQAKRGINFNNDPLLATVIVDAIAMCDVHADEFLNKNLYDVIDESYRNIK